MPSVLTDNAKFILSKRYLVENETPEEMFNRVATHISGCEESDVYDWAEKFYTIMSDLDFIPNSPTMMNAGKPEGSLSACFVLPLDDTIESIMDCAKATALVQKHGGGTGFSLSSIRGESAPIASTHGKACGPISVLQHLDDVSRLITQGGAREGANMAVLRYDHPDILTFIHCKDNIDSDARQVFSRFNISVGVDATFFRMVENNELIPLWHTIGDAEVVTGDTLSARELFDEIIQSAWKTGDPGFIFLDRINDGRSNPVPSFGPITTTNPCGEQPLYSWDSCNLGSLNLSNFILPNTNFDYDRLKEVIPTAVRFLDNVIETNFYVLPQIEKMNKDIRRIGLGVMGWADLLYKMEIRYDSDEAVALGEKISLFIQQQADQASSDLGRERGNFLKFTESIYNGTSWVHMRNSTRTTIAPTGTISIIAGVSSGIEPVFALEFDRQHGENIGKMKEFNPVYREWLVANQNSTRPEYFVTTHEIAAEWHIKHQAAWQKGVDNAVSKTINLPNTATTKDIRAAYLNAWNSGCLGITIYRDGSRTGQVLSTVIAPEDSAWKEDAKGLTQTHEIDRSARKHLPTDRPGLIHKFRVGEQKGYITTGYYEDGCVGEVFVTLTKEGSTMQGLVSTIAKLTSIALQRGVEPDELREDFAGTRFEPAGLTDNENIPTAFSIVDYLFRYLASLNVDISVDTVEILISSSGDTCPDCGSILTHEEGCLKCYGCGYSKC